MRKILVTIAHARNDAENATMGFAMANAGLASGQETFVFLSAEGVRLIEPGYAAGIHEDGFRPLNQMMDGFVTAGGQILVCAPSLKRRGLTERDVQFGAKVVCGAFIMEILSQDAGSLSY